MNDYYENLRKIEQSLRQTGRTTLMIQDAVQHARAGGTAVVVMRDEQQAQYALSLLPGVEAGSVTLPMLGRVVICTPLRYESRRKGRENVRVFIDHAVRTDDLIAIALIEHGARLS